MKVINDLVRFISELNLADVIFLGTILVLLILIISLIYILKSSEEDIVIEEICDDDIDLIELKSNLECIKPVKKKEISDYQAHQEENAIISYDELLNTQSLPVIKYTSTDELDGLLVKAIDVNNLVNTMDPKPINNIETHAPKKHKPNVISYDKEEAFLITLKKLQKMLD